MSSSILRPFLLTFSSPRFEAVLIMKPIYGRFVAFAVVACALFSETDARPLPFRFIQKERALLSRQDDSSSMSETELSSLFVVIYSSSVCFR